MPVLSTRIVLDCFYLLILYSEKFSTDVCRLPYAVNVNLNLSSTSVYSSWRRPCKFNELRAVVEFYSVETTFIFGINLLVAVPTTLRLV